MLKKNKRKNAEIFNKIFHQYMVKITKIVRFFTDIDTIFGKTTSEIAYFFPFRKDFAKKGMVINPT